ncbi:MAG TPA: tRNA (adenosine(37)-N6)-dimethylallyltransferase MiaA, partial [Burkholderiales bacterium]|nr:tRNA (adenosine(37)-N6)-dimethylallyltransferase MiaA [Burkholderiales bacterium]
SVVPHHLIDIIDPHEAYSAARFRDDALAAMREITERGRIPLLVGGTMLYFQALVEGLNELPEADPMIRLVIDTIAQEQGWPAVYGKLKEVDPATAARLEPNDKQRVQRALEIYYITGKTMAELLQKPRYVYFPYTPIKIALIPDERALLHERIEERFQRMLESGLVEEVERLREEYGLDATAPSMRCVGYRQALQHLDGDLTREELVAHGVAATRQLAKRQLTWLRSMTDATVFECFDERLAATVLQHVQTELSRLAPSD